MTAEDIFTRWPIAVAIPDKTAEEIADAFNKHVIAEHGSCEELLTDNAKELTGLVINDIAKKPLALVRCKQSLTIQMAIM